MKNKLIKEKIIDILLFVLDWTWCIPQTLAGTIKAKWGSGVLCKAKDASLAQIKQREKEWRVTILLFCRKSREEHWLFQKISGSGMGRNIFLYETEPDNGEIDDPETIKHEYGHILFSRITGPFFLPTVGIFSPMYNLIGRKKMKNGMTWPGMAKWYYSRWCERVADKLAKVDRKKWLEERGGK